MRRILAAAAMFGLAAAAEPARAGPGAAPVITRPTWDRLPTGDDLARYYPERAQRLEVEGRVVMVCRVKATGDLVACEVVSETPPDMGFGEATLKLAPLFRMKPATRDGVPVDGALVRLPIVFRLPDGPPPTGSHSAEARAAGEAAARAVETLRRPKVTGADLEALRQRTPKLHVGPVTGPWAWLTLGALALLALLGALGVIVRRERGRPTDI